MPAREAKIAMVRWWIEPLPAEPNASCPGLDFASATNSCSDAAGTEGLTTSTVGTEASAVISVKSRSGWKLMPEFTATLIASAPESPKNSV